MRTFGKWLGRLLLLVLIGVVGFLIVGPGIADKSMNPVVEHTPYPVSAEAQAFHDNLIVGDWHADSLLWNRNLNKRHDRGHVDIPRLIEGNVALQVFTAVTKSPSGLNYDQNSAEAWDDITTLAIAQLWPVGAWFSLYDRALHQADKLHRFEAESDGRLKIIRNRADLDAVLTARAEGRDIVGGILGTEGSHPLEGKIENLDGMVDAGYRLFGLQHFFDNEVGGSLHGFGNHGLTDFGRELVQALQDRNLILDLAHSSPQVVVEVLKMTDMPLVLSHTGIWSHCQVKRNIMDELMKAIAETGGVIGIGYWADVTCDDSPKGVAGAIRAAIDVVGEDHVSLGSDYDGTIKTSFDTSELPALTQALMDAGLTDAQIAKVMGENMVRVLRARLGD